MLVISKTEGLAFKIILISMHTINYFDTETNVK